MAKKRTVRLQRNLHLLKALHKANSSRRKQLLYSCDSDFRRCIEDCCKNVLNGNIPLSESDKKKLSKHKKTLRILAGPLSSYKKKSKIYKIQRGGFLGSLIPALLGPIIGVVSSLITGKKNV